MNIRDFVKDSLHKYYIKSKDLFPDKNTVTPITWSELKSLRDNSQLIPGMQYRITDYNTTTSQENTQAAGHQFDIIVTADSSNKLNENARACLHAGDTYFSTAGAKLESWELKYCLDNDTTRFAWASVVPYIPIADIETIKPDYSVLPESFHQFIDAEGYNYEDQDCKFRYEGNAEAWGFSHDDGASINTDYLIYLTEEQYNSDSLCTFRDERGSIEYQVSVGLINGSIIRNNCKGVIYWMKDEWNNECPYDFKNIQFKRKISLENGYPELDKQGGTDTWVYTFAATSYHITNEEWSGLKDGSLESPYGHMSDETTSTYHDNVIEKYFILFEDEDYTKYGKQYLNDNVFLGYWEEVGSDDPENYPYYYAYCSYGLKFGLNCYNNTFGNDCRYNTFGNSCGNNTFGNYCYGNTFGNDCYGNTFGNDCRYNTFGNDCQYNTFGNDCRYNTFGDYCRNNTFGDYCQYNTFGDYCRNISVQKNYVNFIIVENGNQNIDITSTQTTSSTNVLRNFTISQGVNNAYRKTISHNTVNDTFQTVYRPVNSQIISV